eukprot:NODE_828_length_3655_cov_0.833802.p3 type:complete len:243 gc:universal NODE_828_length_3655_cov_0.833802:1763-1035(-)
MLLYLTLHSGLQIAKINHSLYCKMNNIQYNCERHIYENDEKWITLLRLFLNNPPLHITKSYGIAEMGTSQIAVYSEKCKYLPKFEKLKEYRKMSRDVLNGIHYLHSNGYHHMGMEYKHVVQCGDIYKLSGIAFIGELTEIEAPEDIRRFKIDKINSSVYNMILYGRLMYRMLHLMINKRAAPEPVVKCFKTKRFRMFTMYDLDIMDDDERFNDLVDVLIATMNCDLNQIPSSSKLMQFKWFK